MSLSNRRILFSKIFHSLNLSAINTPDWRITNYFSLINVENFLKYARSSFTCNICSARSTPIYDFPNVNHRKNHCISLLSETLQCRSCHSSMRDRSMAYVLSSLYFDSNSILNVSSSPFAFLDTDSFTYSSRHLSASLDHYFQSSFKPDYPPLYQFSSKRFNIDLQSIPYDNHSFDCVLTSDVMEHVRDDHLAHKEIFRVLKNSGTYIFTVPFSEKLLSNRVLIDISSDHDIYLEPPHYHGDSLSDKIISYRIYGLQLIQNLTDIGFHVQFLPLNVPSSGIFGAEVFLARKLK